MLLYSLLYVFIFYTAKIRKSFLECGNYCTHNKLTCDTIEMRKHTLNKIELCGNDNIIFKQVWLMTLFIYEIHIILDKSFILNCNILKALVTFIKLK